VPVSLRRRDVLHFRGGLMGGRGGLDHGPDAGALILARISTQVMGLRTMDGLQRAGALAGEGRCCGCSG
jgi:hypothetical protein